MCYWTEGFFRPENAIYSAPVDDFDTALIIVSAMCAHTNAHAGIREIVIAIEIGIEIGIAIEIEIEIEKSWDLETKSGMFTAWR